MTIGKVNFKQSNSNLYMSSQHCTCNSRVASNNLQNNTLNKAQNDSGSNNQKLLIGLGTVALSLLGVGLGVVKCRSSYINESQKMFQELFLDKNITKKQTVEMLKRYKKISKIEDKIEYTTALFKETKRNFKLGKGLRLEYNDMLPERRGGGNFVKAAAIELNPAWSREQLTNAVFHELRHAKQDYLAINYDIDQFFEALDVKSPEVKEFIIPYLQQKCGLTTFGKENIPEGVEDSFIEKCLNGYRLKHYKDGEKVCFNGSENFLEDDARVAGNLGAAIMNDSRLKHFI